MRHPRDINQDRGVKVLLLFSMALQEKHGELEASNGGHGDPGLSWSPYIASFKRTRN